MSSISRKWALQIISDLNGLHSTYTVLFFLGDVPPTPSVNGLEWLEAKSFIGRHVALTSSNGNRPEILTRSVINLDGRLRASNVITSKPDDVVQYIRDHLRWRIRMANGEVVSNMTLPSLKVVLLSEEQQYNAEDDFYQAVGRAIEHLDCTTCSSGY